MEKLKNFILNSIKEDCPTKDITTTTLGIDNSPTEAKLIAKDSGIFFGKQIIKESVKLFQNMTENNTLADGSKLNKSDIISTIKGNYTDILLLERTLLNFLQHLSGIATQTNKAVQILDNPAIKICDTRKTIPGFRQLAKQAVKAGGGFNHREGLSDMILIKENHINAIKKENKLNDVSINIKKIKSTNPSLMAELEIESINDLSDYNLTLFDYILLDNFKIIDIEDTVKTARQLGFSGEFECSGNITHDTISLYKNVPIQRLSMGCLTHSVRAFDITLLF
jgi:nicotinate-nucleotide pyrophosphorylase (carboxylating)